MSGSIRHTIGPVEGHTTKLEPASKSLQGGVLRRVRKDCQSPKQSDVQSHTAADSAV